MSDPPNSSEIISPLPPFTPDLYHRAWSSIPHPSGLPLLATPHANSVTVFSLSNFTQHSVLQGGHERSVRAAAWQPNLPPGKLRLVTGSFDSTVGVWRYTRGDGEGSGGMEKEVKMGGGGGDKEGEGDGEEEEDDWEFDLVLEGHNNEVKSVSWSPSGEFLATSSRDKSVWIWENTGDEDWETLAVLEDHEGDVKSVAWCPAVEGRMGMKGHYNGDLLASGSYDNTARLWREDSDGDWVCVAVLEGHEGTVWGVEWEGREEKKGFPRLLTCGADRDVRVWRLVIQEEEEEEGWTGGIPNTMRRELREEWVCEAVLPRVHERDVYSVTWNKETGMVATTGSDGMIVLYGEEKEGEDIKMDGTAPAAGRWKVLAVVRDAHGPYEINHITWCKRFDPGAEEKGKEEMLVTTGDDGVVRPWQVRIQ